MSPPGPAPWSTTIVATLGGPPTRPLIAGTLPETKARTEARTVIRVFAVPGPAVSRLPAGLLLLPLARRPCARTLRP